MRGCAITGIISFILGGSILIVGLMSAMSGYPVIGWSLMLLGGIIISVREVTRAQELKRERRQHKEEVAHLKKRLKVIQDRIARLTTEFDT